MKIVSERVIEMPGRVLAGLLVLWIALSILPSPGVGEES
jgi:hypothetical protein